MFPLSQPAVQDEGRLRQHRQQRMMTVASRPARVVTPGRALLGARALQHRRIQIQREALPGTTQEPQQPDPQRPPETLDARLGETMEEAAHRVGARPAGQTQQRMQRAIRASHLGVREAARAHHHADEERRQRVAQRDGVGTGQLPRQMRLHLAGIADLLKEGDEADQPAEGRDRPGSFREFDFGGVEKRGYKSLHRSVPFWVRGWSCQTHSASDPRNRTTFFHLSFSGSTGLDDEIELRHEPL